MKNNFPRISIIIPTYNSEKVIEACLRGIKNQEYPKDKIETIVVDNNSADNTISMAKNYGAKIYSVRGKPPQVCRQRNLGAQKADGEYIYILDHDMEMFDNLLKDLAKNIVKSDHKIDAWYVPEKIVGNNRLWNKIRSFERSFYSGTVIDAARIIKKEKFNLSPKFDPELSSGPADWDFDIELRKMGCNFGIISKHVNHYEQYLTLRKYLAKKAGYSEGGEKYKEKWKNLDKNAYNNIIRKQYGISYRFLKVFTEKGKWKKAAKEFYLFIPMIFIKTLIGLTYLSNKRQTKDYV